MSSFVFLFLRLFNRFACFGDAFGVSSSLVVSLICNRFLLLHVCSLFVYMICTWFLVLFFVSDICVCFCFVFLIFVFVFVVLLLFAFVVYVSA